MWAAIGRPPQPNDEAARGKWWESFHDPQLNALEEKLNISNQNIAAAAANVQVARALIREARSQYFPTVTANPAHHQFSACPPAFGQTVGTVFNTFALPLEASWEPDLWGRIRNTVKANTFAAQASVADLENVRLSAQADLAADYYELRAQDALKQVLDSTVSAYQEALELTIDLYHAGLAQRRSGRAGGSPVESHAGAGHQSWAFCALSMNTPSRCWPASPRRRFRFRPKRREPLRPRFRSAFRRSFSSGVPISPRRSARSRRRMRRSASPKTAFFPAVTLSAGAGFQSLSIAKWLAWPSRVWSVGPSLAETIFDGGLRKATVQQFQASYDQTVANYRQTVLTAFQQVEDNLAALRILTQVIEQQDSAIESAARSLRLAEVRYRAGLDPYLNVITAQTALLNDQQAAVNFRAQQMVASVQLIKALGGGWDVSRLPSVKELGSSVIQHPEAKPAR